MPIVRRGFRRAVVWVAACVLCICIAAAGAGLKSDEQSELPADFFYDSDGIVVSVGESHACAIEHRDGQQEYGGRVTCWGVDHSNQIESPDGIFLQVSVGFTHSCAIAIDETVKCWGTIDTAPSGLFIQISSGRSNVCGVRKDGTIRCWGVNVHGVSTPPPGKFNQVTCGKKHCCALNYHGKPVCWGDNRQGQLVPPEGVKFRQISASLADTTCGITEEQNIQCWGSNKKQFPRKTGQFIQVSAGRGDESLCAITAEARQLQCFGNLASLAKAKTNDREWAEVVAGHLCVCAVDMYSNLHCWGIGGANKPPKDIFVVTITAYYAMDKPSNSNAEDRPTRENYCQHIAAKCIQQKPQSK